MSSVAAINNLGGHTHNPRGNLWFKDESAYGHKLLMKMGWNKGKGLGKNEDGIKENVKVKFRNTNSGLGFKDDAYANVMKTEYESILQNLSAEYSCPWITDQDKDVRNSDEKIPQKSKVVKSKLRYPKLFFGKDVTKYSEKDMKSIFICSTSLKSTEEKSKTPVISEKKDLEVEQSQTFSSNLSISDYFAKKMEMKKNNAFSQNSTNTGIYPKATLESETPEFLPLATNENITSKRNKKDSQVESDKESFDNEDSNQVDTETEGVSTENLASSNKKSSRKRKKKYENNFNNIEVNSIEVEPCITDSIKEEVLEMSSYKNSSNNDKYAVENNINQNSSRPNKKRKVSQSLENIFIGSSESVIPCQEESSLPLTKHKKKKHKIFSATLQLFSENSNHENGNMSEEIPDVNKHVSLEPDEDKVSDITDCRKKKKKSKKKLKEKLKSCLKNRSGLYALKNVSFNEAVSYRIIDTEIESVDPLAYNESLDTNISNELTDRDTNESSDNRHAEKEAVPSEINSNDTTCEKEQCKVLENSDEEYTSRNLPSSQSSHYNAWVESQRLALKMQLYKKMLKNIKSHKILKSTNLLSIKGYGNWGFKMNK